MSSQVWVQYASLFNGETIEVRELVSIYIPHFKMTAITYPWWDWSKNMLVKDPLFSDANNPEYFGYIHNENA